MPILIDQPSIFSKHNCYSSCFFILGRMNLSKAYLVAYNVLQFIGWTILMWQLMPTIISMKAPSSELYANLGGLLRFCQTAAFLEVMHAATGTTIRYCNILLAHWCQWTSNQMVTSVIILCFILTFLLFVDFIG